MAGSYTVSQVNAYIRDIISQDYLLCTLHVKGEASNVKYHSSGHIFFSLKDEKSTITCVMFAGMRNALPFHLTDGRQIVVSGSVRVYEKEGRYQLYAEKISADGQGALYEKYLELKERLEEMGMFAPEYKRPIPPYVRRLGVVTSPTGAAIRDILSVVGHQNPYVDVLIYPALVQGEGAAESIVGGINALSKTDVDVIIVGRGGGSIEDLWAFNEETLAQAIFDSPIPIITGIGHESDWTIADFTADLRAPTPSAAAQLAVYDYYQLAHELSAKKDLLERLLNNRLEIIKYRMLSYSNRLLGLSPSSQIKEKKGQLKNLSERLTGLMTKRLTAYQQRLRLNAEKMAALSPQKKLTQGYAYIRDGCGRPISDIKQVNIGDRLDIHMSGGRIGARVEEIT